MHQFQHGLLPNPSPSLTHTLGSAVMTHCKHQNAKLSYTALGHTLSFAVMTHCKHQNAKQCHTHQLGSHTHTHTHSVHLRPGTGYLVRTLLMVTYCSCLRSISTCIVTSHHRQPIQTTAVWPHRRSFELNISSKSRPGLLQPTFRRSDNMNVHTGVDAKNLSEG